MAFPENFTRIWVRGRLVDLGKLATGEASFGIPKPITFTPSPQVILDKGTNQIIQTTPFSVMPSATDGYFAIELPATNDPDIMPVGWTYAVVEPTGRKYNIVVDFDTPVLEEVGDPLEGLQVLDLISIIPAPGASAGTVQLVGGMVANLGDVYLGGLQGGATLVYDSDTGLWKAQVLDIANAEAASFRSGPTGSRGTPSRGTVFFDTTINRPIIGDGSNWRDFDGNVLGVTGGGGGTGGGGSDPGGTSTPAPQNMRATLDNDARTITLNWDAVSGATYNVYEDRSPEGVTGAMGLTVTTTTRGPFSLGNTYNYWVTAVKNGVESPASAKAGGTIGGTTTGGGGSGGSSGGTTAGTPGALLHIGTASGLNHFNLGIGYSSGHKDIEPADIANGFSDNPYFYINGSKVHFQVYMNGKTTSSGTKYARSELREYDQSGNKAAWNGSSGTHTMEGKSTITHLPPNKASVCFTQIHDAESDLARVQTEGSGSDIKIVMRNTPPGSSSETTTTLMSSYTIGTELSWKWQVVNGTGTFYLNGTAVKTFPAGTSGCYFKTGAYAQSNSTIDSASEYVAVELRDLKQWHTGWPTQNFDDTGGGTTNPGGGTTNPTGQTLGVGGVAKPNGATTGAGGSGTWTITSGGTAGSPKVYDGEGRTVGRLDIKADYVTVQNYKINAQSQYGVFLEGTGITLQNCDISGIKASGDGDLNAITAFGNNITIAYNTAINFVSGSPGGSHTDFIQTWVSSSHPTASSNWVIRGNKATGPANPSRSNSIPSIHQWLMIEDYGRGGNSGGSSSGMKNWLVIDNEIGDSWNQAIKNDGCDNLIITKNRFVGSSTKVIDPASGTTKFYSDNIVGSGYGSVGITQTNGSGPTSL